MSQPSEVAVLAATFRAAYVPRRAVTPADWAAANVILLDGPRRRKTFDPPLTPHLVKPLIFFAGACPDNNKGVFRKSKQIGARRPTPGIDSGGAPSIRCRRSTCS
jgi:hypothetical protein